MHVVCPWSTEEYHFQCLTLNRSLIKEYMYLTVVPYVLKHRTEWKCKFTVFRNAYKDNLCYVPTTDQINSIKPDEAIGYWSDSVGMSDWDRPGRSTLVGITRASYPNILKCSQAVEKCSRRIVYWSSRRSSCSRGIRVAI